MNARLTLMTSYLLLLVHSESAEWEKLPPLPEPNAGFAANVDQGKIVIAGGTNWEGGQKNWLKKVWCFDPAGMKWEALADLKAPVAYTVHGLSQQTREKSVMILAGGANAEGALTQVHFLGAGGFETRQEALTTHCVLAAGGVHQKSLLFCGGAPDATQIDKASNAMWSVDLDTLKVTSLAPCPSVPFVVAGSVMDTAGSLLVFGGGTWDEKNQAVRNLDAAHLFTLATSTWRQLRPLPYAVRGINAAMLDQDKTEAGSKSFVYLAGGYKNDAEGFTDEAFFYDIPQDAYRPAPPLPYKAMVTLVVCQGYLYCLGGEDKKQSRTDACYRIRLAALLE
jgi:hypothetical protein